MIIPKRKEGETLRQWCHRLAIGFDGCKPADLYQVLLAVSEESYSQGSEDTIIMQGEINESNKTL